MLFRAFMLLIGILMVSSAAHAEEMLRCPDTTIENGQSLSLSDSGIFNGPAERGEEIMAEEAEWDIASFREPEQTYYLVCRYSNAGVTRQFVITAGMDYCRPAGDNIECR